MQELKDIRYLLNELSSHNEMAFRRIFDAFSGQVYSFSLRLTRSKENAEEIVQEVFLKIWINRELLSTIDNFPAYLYTLTRNLALNNLKRIAVEKRTHAMLQHEMQSKDNVTEQTVIHHDYEQFLSKAINHLPPQQRLVYSLCHQEGLRYDEVAQRLKISKLTVKTHMQHALRSIKSQFTHILKTGF
jgi:RNA polymerase sigma-70 factor (family 1)